MSIGKVLQAPARAQPRRRRRLHYAGTAIIDSSPAQSNAAYELWTVRKADNIQTIDNFLGGPGNLDGYTLILVTLPLAPELLEIISEHSQKTGVPVFYIHCVGFYSHFTVQLPSAFPIVDTHPDPASTTDLRLLEPWPELLQVVKEKTADLEQMDDEQHGHVPYLLLLLHYLEKWKSIHGGEPPQNYKEKVEFREMVREGTRTKNAEGGEENFEEAVGAVLKSLNPPVQNLTAEVRVLWLLLFGRLH